MKKIIIPVIVFIALITLSGSMFIVDEAEQAIITQFGKPVGDAYTTAGIKFKIPFIQTVHKFDKRWLAWDGDASQITTKDKKYIWVDTYARWRITDPLKFFEAVHDETGAQTRLDDIIDGETRIAAARFNLIELVRSNNRKMDIGTLFSGGEQSRDEFRIKVGRDKITRMILEKVSKVVPSYGIEVVDVRIKRLNYVESVRRKVYERMISERKRIAEQYRSEGLGKKAEIIGKTQRELESIRSEAYKLAEEVKGKADAEATKIYANAYSKDVEFYRFMRNLESIEKTISKKDTFVISTNSEYYKILKRLDK